VPAPLRSLADQVVRSATSVAANLSEGHGRSGRDRPQHWRIAYASAKEVDTHLRLLVGAGAVDPNGPDLRSSSSTRCAPWPGGCCTRGGERRRPEHGRNDAVPAAVADAVPDPATPPDAVVAQADRIGGLALALLASPRLCVNWAGGWRCASLL